jgi:hypothetical protein
MWWTNCKRFKGQLLAYIHSKFWGRWPIVKKVVAMVWHPKHVDNVLVLVAQKVLGIVIEIMKNTPIMWSCTND